MALPRTNQTGVNEWSDVETNDQYLYDELFGNITNSNIDSAAAIAHSKLAAIATGQVLLGNAGVPTATTLSGDATVSATGVVTIAPGVIDSSAIEDGAVGAAEIATGAVGADEIAANAVGTSEITTLPGCRVYRSATQSIADSTDTIVLYDTGNATELFDTDTMHSLTTNSGRITFTTAGVYLITAGVNWTVNGTGRRNLEIGTADVASVIAEVSTTNPSGSVATPQNVSTIYKAAAADFVVMRVHQTSGGALNSAGGQSTYFAAQWLSD